MFRHVSASCLRNVYCLNFGVRQMQTADLQTCTWVSQTRTSVSQNSTSVRLFRLDGIGNTIYNLPVCSLQSAYVAHHLNLAFLA